MMAVLGRYCLREIRSESLRYPADALAIRRAVCESSRGSVICHQEEWPWSAVGVGRETIVRGARSRSKRSDGGHWRERAATGTEKGKTVQLTARPFCVRRVVQVLALYR